MKIFKNFGIKDYIYILLIVVFISLQVYLDLKMPDYMSKITVLVQTEGSKLSSIIENGVYMLLCAFFSLLGAIVSCYLTAELSASFSLNIRKKIYEKVLNLGIYETKNFSTGSLITRTTNDITQIEMLLSMGLAMLIKSPVTAIWAIYKIHNKSYQWGLATFLAVIILLVFIAIILIIVMPRFKKIQKYTDKVNGVIRENLTGIRVIRAFNKEKYQEDKFNKINDDLTDTLLFTQKRFALFSPIMYLVMYFLALAIYCIGAYLIDTSSFDIKIDLFGDMIVFSSYALQIIMSFLMLAVIFMVLPRAQVSIDRINEVLDTKESIKEGNVTDVMEKGTIEFKNVYFKYPDSEEYLLEDISFKVNKGEMVAIIGSTGSGKTSLIDLIPRFYEATKGEVLVDGINVKELSNKKLNDILGYVSQKPSIFKGTIKSNINFGNIEKSIKKDKLEDAIDVSMSSDFINELEDKSNSYVAPNGVNYSGGQKQRLSIARAIYKNPEIFIFDDSFSALDYKTDSELRKKLKEYTKDSTILIVAQRIGTILHADKILVLDDGKLIGVGTHKELMKNCEEYRKIAYSQLSKEELENA